MDRPSDHRRYLYGKPDSDEQQWPRLALHCHRVVVDGIAITAPLPPRSRYRRPDIQLRAAANPAAAAAGLRVSASNAAPATSPATQLRNCGLCTSAANRPRHRMLAVVRQQMIGTATHVAVGMQFGMQLRAPPRVAIHARDVDAAAGAEFLFAADVFALNGVLCSTRPSPSAMPRCITGPCGATRCPRAYNGSCSVPHSMLRLQASGKQDSFHLRRARGLAARRARHDRGCWPRRRTLGRMRNDQGPAWSCNGSRPSDPGRCTTRTCRAAASPLTPCLRSCVCSSTSSPCASRGAHACALPSAVRR